MKYATKLRLGRREALRRLATTAREDADNCDDEALAEGLTVDAKYVRKALQLLSVELDERARKIVP